MASARTEKVDGEELIFHVGRASQASEFQTVSLKRYECCPLLKFRTYPCHHVCHVCSVAKPKLRVADFMPRCHTTKTWRAQLGLSALPQAPLPSEPTDEQGRDDLRGNVLRARCPLPDTNALLKESARGAHLRLVLAIRPGARAPMRCAKLITSRACPSSPTTAMCAHTHILLPWVCSLRAAKRSRRSALPKGHRAAAAEAASARKPPDVRSGRWREAAQAPYGSNCWPRCCVSGA
jgi:hypothetical protein